MHGNSRLFSRRKEDFVCAHCGYRVKGNGYTDHCPACLWSVHVDKNPGDRAARCGGAMKPVSAECDRFGTFTIRYVCLKCGARKRFKQAANDDRNVLEGLLNKKE